MQTKTFILYVINRDKSFDSTRKKKGCGDKRLENFDTHNAQGSIRLYVSEDTKMVVTW